MSPFTSLDIGTSGPDLFHGATKDSLIAFNCSSVTPTNSFAVSCATLPAAIADENPINFLAPDCLTNGSLDLISLKPNFIKLKLVLYISAGNEIKFPRGILLKFLTKLGT